MCEVLVPGAIARGTRRLLGAMLHASGADYAVRVGDHSPRAGYLPLPGQGPTLVWRDVVRTDARRRRPGGSGSATSSCSEPGAEYERRYGVAVRLPGNAVLQVATLVNAKMAS